jgi:GntR family transcriptional regulator
VASQTDPALNASGARIRSDNRPLYLQAEDALRDLLQSGAYPPGVRLPTEPDLAQQLGISRSTLREAMRSFEEKGLISRRQGVGTFVNPPVNALPIDSGLETLESVDTLVRRRGVNVFTAELEISSETASAEMADLLQVSVGSELTRVTRTKVSSNRPLAFMSDWLPANAVSTHDIRSGFAGSVLDYLLAREDLDITHAAANVIPMTADKVLADRLNVPEGTSLLLLEETAYDRVGKVVGFSRNYFVPEFFKFHVVRRITPLV